MISPQPIPAVCYKTARTDVSTKANALGVRPMQERACIGRGFRNYTERLEKLFELYTEMTAKGKAA